MNPTHWSEDSGLMPAAGLVSTTRDLLTYVEVQMGLIQTPLAPAIALAQKQYFFASGDDEADRGLAWHLSTDASTSEALVDHDGQAAGFRSVIAFSSDKKAGVVVLMNNNRDQNADDAYNLLDAILAQ